MLSKTLLTISLFLLSAFAPYLNAKTNIREKPEETPITILFLGERIVFDQHFNNNKKLLEDNRFIALCAKLAGDIYLNKSGRIKVEAGILLSYVLYNNDMKIAALQVLQSILIHKAHSPLVPQVFNFMVLIIGDLNNDYIVSNFFNLIDRKVLSRDNRTAINYYYAKALYQEHHYKESARFFEGVTEKHHGGKYYYLSRYYLATINYLRGKKRKAIPYLEDIFASHEKIPMELVAQSRLLAGRIYSDLNMLKESVENYEKVPQRSLTWDQALLEISWIYLKMGDYKKVVGRTHSLNSPFFMMYYFPDGYMIEALGYMKLCRFGRVKYILDQFEQTYTSYLPQLKKFSGSYQDLFRKKSLPSRIVKTFARNKMFMSLHEGLQLIRFEDARLDRLRIYAAEKRPFSKVAKKLYAFLSGKFRMQRRHHLKKLNSYLKSEKKILIKKLRELHVKYEFIQYEMYAQAKTYLEFSMIEANKVIFSDAERKASADNRLYIWKFDYEYWKDELPYYEFAGVNLCKKR